MLDKIESTPLNNTPFQQACADGNLQTCKELLADSLIMNDIQAADLAKGLALAVQNSHVQVVELLLENKASIYIEKSANEETPTSFGQLVDRPILSCHTVFSLCSNAEIYNLLCQSLGPNYFTQPQGLVIACEMIIALFTMQLANNVFMWGYLNNVQSIANQLSQYTYHSIVALNALAKVFFDSKDYQGALICYQLVNNLLTTKVYLSNTIYSTNKITVSYAKNFVDYNINVVQLKIKEINNDTSEYESYTTYFKNIGDIFAEDQNYVEAEQSYKKSIVYCKVDNHALKIKRDTPGRHPERSEGSPFILQRRHPERSEGPPAIGK